MPSVSTKIEVGARSVGIFKELAVLAKELMGRPMCGLHCASSSRPPADVRGRGENHSHGMPMNWVLEIYREAIGNSILRSAQYPRFALGVPGSKLASYTPVPESGQKERSSAAMAAQLLNLRKGVYDPPVIEACRLACDIR